MKIISSTFLYHQNIADLSKENFNLKLRIYFLEEKVKQKFEGGEDLQKIVSVFIVMSHLFLIFFYYSSFLNVTYIKYINLL